MARYVLLITLTPEGRENILDDPNLILRAEEGMDSPNARIIGLYAVLGEIDFIAIVEANNNETAAQFALELGVRAGLHTTTMPAIPISRLEHRRDPTYLDEDILTLLNPPGGNTGDGDR